MGENASVLEFRTAYGVVTVPPVGTVGDVFLNGVWFAYGTNVGGICRQTIEWLRSRGRVENAPQIGIELAMGSDELVIRQILAGTYIGIEMDTPMGPRILAIGPVQ